MARTPNRRNIRSADARETTVDDYIKEYQKAVDEANKRNAAKLAVYLKEVDEKRLSDDVEERSRQIEALEKHKKLLESQGTAVQALRKFPFRFRGKAQHCSPLPRQHISKGVQALRQNTLFCLLCRKN